MKLSLRLPMKLKKYVGVVKADADHNQSTASQPMHAE